MKNSPGKDDWQETMDEIGKLLFILMIPILIIITFNALFR